MKIKTVVILIVALMLLAAFTACSRSKSGMETAPQATPETAFEFADGAITGYTGTAKTVVIPSQIQGQAVTMISDWAFQEKQLTSVVIPNSVTTINPLAFAGNPLTSITIGANVDFWLPGDFGERIDFFNESFDNVYNSGGQQAGTYTLNNGVWSLNGTALAQAATAETDFYFVPPPGPGFAGGAITEYRGTATSVVIPSQIWEIPVASIGGFLGHKLTSVTIPDTVTSIEFEAFSGNQLSSVTIPNSVIRIESAAFERNPLTSITIGANVEISEYAFANNFANIYNINGKRAGTYTFGNGVWAFNGTAITAPYSEEAAFAAMQDAIDAAMKWWDDVPMITDSFDQIWNYNNTDITATWSRGMLSFKGTGVLDGNSTNGFYPWLDPHLDVNIVIIGNGITRIGVGAFVGKQITSITIGSNVVLGMRGGANYLPAFEEAFESVYYNGGQQAGTYIKENGVWRKAEGVG